MNRKHALALVAGILAAGALGVVVGRSTKAPAASPVEAADPAAANTVAITPQRIQATGIELVRAEARGLAPELIAQATVSSPVGAEAVLGARADGALVRLLKRLGDPVRAGETVALIESREASAIASDRATSQARLQEAQAKYAREKRLFDAGVSARQDFEAARAELATAEAEMRRSSAAGAAARVSSDGRNLAVVSPVAGRISATPVALGAYVTAGTEIYRVVDPGRIEVRATLPAAEASRIAVGDAARLDVSDGRTLSATVRAVTPDADPVSRAATVVLAPGSGQPALKPGQAVQARISVKGVSTAPALTLPAEAVQLLDGREVVFVRTRDGFRAQPVASGAHVGDRIEIAGGLPAGAVVAGRNAFLLKAELAAGGDEEGH